MIIISSQVLDMDEQMDIDSGLEPGLLTEVQLKALIQNVRESIIFQNESISIKILIFEERHSHRKTNY